MLLLLRPLYLNFWSNIKERGYTQRVWQLIPQLDTLQWKGIRDDGAVAAAAAIADDDDEEDEDLCPTERKHDHEQWTITHGVILV